MITPQEVKELTNQKQEEARQRLIEDKKKLASDKSIYIEETYNIAMSSIIDERIRGSIGSPTITVWNPYKDGLASRRIDNILIGRMIADELVSKGFNASVEANHRVIIKP